MAAQVKVLVTPVGGIASQAAVRQHRSYVDRPEAKGGSDRGPMGGELMLMGIGGCFMSNLLAAAKARELDVPLLCVEVTATTADEPPRFSAIELTVSGGSADRQAMAELVASAERTCTTVNTVRGALALTVKLAG